MKALTFIDFCAWIWWGRLALENNGMVCLWFSEIDKDAEITYRLIHNTKEENFWDLTKIDCDKLPDFDFLIAWFPCQSFSIMWERKWMNDERWQIIFHIVDILKAKKIKYFILENVKWLVNHDGWETLKIIIKLLDDAWYYVNWKVLNSIDFWVPQMRERIYFAWFRKDLIPSDFAFEFPDKITDKIKIEQFLSDTDISQEEDLGSNDTFIRYLWNKYNQNRYSLDAILQKDFTVLDTRQSDLRLYDKKVPTIRRWRQWIFYVRDWKIRKLSWYESLLLQWFPKKYANRAKNKISDSNLLKQSWNAMTVNTVQKIAEKMLLYI